MFSRSLPRIASASSAPQASYRAIARLSSTNTHPRPHSSPITPQPHRPSHSTRHNLTTMPPVSSTMKAIVAEKVGGPEVLEVRSNHPVPTPQEGQLLVKNQIIGINYIDTYFRTGLYPSSKPEILGREAVGTVVALGPGANPYNFQVGDRVAWMAPGSYAEYSAVPQVKTVKVPENISDEDAMASFLSGLTVLTLAKETYPVQKGDWVLLHAAAGGAGFLMTQVLTDIGATVIGTAGGPEKVELVKSLGADYVIDYRSEEGKDWVKKVKEITDGRGVDVVYDSVGKDTWEGSLEAVKRKGTIIWFGNASGPVPPLPLPKLSPKCVKIARPTLFGYIETREELEFYVNQLFQLLATGKLKTKVHKVYPLDQVAQAHNDLEGRKTTGKLLLKA